ncbi:uncharacterized protein VTP21DRAFT_10161 [Calcarisporiella thermophila]|uniref:uncharacterized protein n=1 Tax=Calcarisporiella thermophila TaxID=911321 RepID=UPI00374290D1
MSTEKTPAELAPAATDAPKVTEETVEQPQEPGATAVQEPAQGQPAPEATEVPAAEQAEEEKKEPSLINAGSLLRRGPKPLRLWQRRYYVFRSEPHTLDQLQMVHRKNARKFLLGIGQPAASNPPPATAEGGAVEEAKPKEKEAEKPKGYEAVNRALFTDIAAATQSGAGMLFVYRSVNELTRPLGIINLRDVESVEPISVGKNHAFRIVSSRRVHELAAGSAEEFESWIHTLRLRVSEAKELPPVEESEGFKTVYESLVSRKAFVIAKPTSDAPAEADVFSGEEGEPEAEGVQRPEEVKQEGAEGEEGEVPTLTKRKSLFGTFSLRPSRKDKEAAPKEGICKECEVQETVNDAQDAAAISPTGEASVEKAQEASEEAAAKAKPKFGTFKLFGAKKSPREEKKEEEGAATEEQNTTEEPAPEEEPAATASAEDEKKPTLEKRHSMFGKLFSKKEKPADASPEAEVDAEAAQHQEDPAVPETTDPTGEVPGEAAEAKDHTDAKKKQPLFGKIFGKKTEGKYEQLKEKAEGVVETTTATTTEEAPPTSHEEQAKESQGGEQNGEKSPNQIGRRLTQFFTNIKKKTEKTEKGEKAETEEETASPGPVELPPIPHVADEQKVEGTPIVQAQA